MVIQEFQIEKREEAITIRTSQEIKKWIKENKISPTKFFNIKIKEVMKEVEDA